MSHGAYEHNEICSRGYLNSKLLIWNTPWVFDFIHSSDIKHPLPWPSYRTAPHSIRGVTEIMFTWHGSPRRGAFKCGANKIAAGVHRLTFKEGFTGALIGTLMKIPPMELYIPLILHPPPFFFFKVFGGHVHMSFLGATGTPVLDFWWRLLWVSKPEWVCLIRFLCRWM